MNGDTRLHDGLEPRASPVGSATAGGGAPNGPVIGPRRLCGARPRHQQLPPAGRTPDPRRLSRDRRLLAHLPARRRGRSDRTALRGGHGPRHRCLESLPPARCAAAASPAAVRWRPKPAGKLQTAPRFLDRVETETGIRLEIISPVPKKRVSRSPAAQLAARSRKERAPPCSTSAAVRPRSSGSARSDGRGRGAPIKAWISLPPGVVPLADVWAATTSRRNPMRGWWQRSREMWRPSRPHRRRPQGLQLLGPLAR